MRLLRTVSNEEMLFSLKYAREFSRKDSRIKVDFDN
jgi:hypothetical protein